MDMGADLRSVLLIRSQMMLLGRIAETAGLWNPWRRFKGGVTLTTLPWPLDVILKHTHRRAAIDISVNCR